MYVCVLSFIFILHADFPYKKKKKKIYQKPVVRKNPWKNRGFFRGVVKKLTENMNIRESLGACQ